MKRKLKLPRVLASTVVSLTLGMVACDGEESSESLICVRESADAGGPDAAACPGYVAKEEDCPPGCVTEFV